MRFKVFVGFEVFVVVNIKCGMHHCIVCWVGTNVLDKPDAFFFRINYKTTQKNVVLYPSYFLHFCVPCAVFLCMV